MQKSSKGLLLPLAWLVLTAILLWPRAPKRVAGDLPQEVYVWHRAWNAPVLEALADQSTSFSGLVVLAGEVNWRDGQPELVKVPINYGVLRAVQRPVSLALRIGSFPGPFRPDARAEWLAETARQVVTEAATNEVLATELQIDFDCAEAKLEGYKVWLESIRRAVAPMRLTITALPAWLLRTSFKRLLTTVDGFVVQVHSLERPASFNAPFTLFDLTNAYNSVETAARFSKPFRVALPTYGYSVAFDANGKFIGLTAEGPHRAWPARTQVREVRSDPKAIAELVAAWHRNRSRWLQGLIWYRLPVKTDELNWTWPTLAAVMSGRSPVPDVKAERHAPEPGLVEVALLNSGDADYAAPVGVTVTWPSSRLAAADGSNGFQVIESGTNRLQFTNASAGLRFRPNERKPIGWLRLDPPTEVKLEPHLTQP